MNRRAAIKVGLILGATHAGALRAQQQSKIPVIGVPTVTAGATDVIMQSLRKGLSARGLVDGKSIRIEHRASQGSLARLDQNVNELVSMGTDIFVAGNEAIARSVLRATNGTVPIVLLAWDYDPVETGLIESLSHPGKNITGVSTRSVELIGKRLEILTDLQPRIKRVSVLYDSFGVDQLKYFQAPAASLGLELKFIPLHPAYDYAAAVRVAKNSGASALVITFSPRFWIDRAQIIQPALTHKLITISYESMTVRDGALISYGPSMTATWERLGYFVARLLKGERANDLPVEQPDLFELAVNFKTAKALGLTIPESIMMRVNEVVK